MSLVFLFHYRRFDNYGFVCFQIEIQNKLKDANNVIEILSDIIGDSTKRDKDDSPRDSHRRSTDKTGGDKFNYIHYDPEVHWCRICDIFPRTAKDFLMHLHSKEHKKLMQDENIENPWHKLPKDPEFPFYEGAPKKRLPIKGKKAKTVLNSASKCLIP